MQFRLSITEIKMNVKDDPHIDDKREIVEQMTLILKEKRIRSIKRNYSILEDALILCILFNWQLREKCNIYEKRFFEKMVEQFQFERTFEAYKRRIQHLKMFEWSLQILEQIYHIIVQNIPLDNVIIKYDIPNKQILLPKIEENEENWRELTDDIIENGNQLKQLKKCEQDIISQRISNILQIDEQKINEDMKCFSTKLKFIMFLLKAI